MVVESKETNFRILSPVLVNLYNLQCIVGGAGAMLSAEINVLVTDGEILEGIQLTYNGNPPNNAPEFQGTSSPFPGTTIHNYTWNESVSCGATYNVEVVASVILKKSSGVQAITCGPC